VKRFHPSDENVLNRFGARLLNVLTLGRLEPGPPPGHWRSQALGVRQDNHLFNEILVPVSGAESGWFALEQAFVIARREEGRLFGLHVVASEELRESQVALEVQAEFNRRCLQAGIQGRLVISTGDISREICSRARWTDLVVANLAYPPAAQFRARLESGFREMIERCPGPLLAAPQTATGLSSALLAYDGSPKAREALFIATYLAGEWQIPLTVVEALTDPADIPQFIPDAQDYLEQHHVSAHYVAESGPVGEVILKVAEQRQAELLIVGGYGRSPVLEVMLGSTVDHLLRESNRPMLICR
jgi:nucleotide-binding universal stress UspA family protein